jgi:hypothetical protein
MKNNKIFVIVFFVVLSLITMVGCGNKENGEIDVPDKSTSDDVVQAEESNNANFEWYKTYTKVIDYYVGQQNEKEIYFVSDFLSDGYTEEGSGGVSVGQTINSEQLMFYIKDINKDDIPELFIGAQSSNDISIIAVYSFYPEQHAARLKANIDFDYGAKAIYLFSFYENHDDLLLEYPNYYDNKVLVFSEHEGDYISALQSEMEYGVGWDNDSVLNYVINTADLEWQPLNKW